MLEVSDEVRTALDEGRPVVALESTLIAHGLPSPDSLEVAAQLEQDVRSEGAVPATIAVFDGVPVVGVTDFERLTPEIHKLSSRDLAPAIALKATGATTVSATARLAHEAGIRVFATGGIGGVHREAPYDESTDLTELGRTPIVVVSAGVKSILDVGATLERLETLGVTVLGWRTNSFPGFYLRDSGHPVDWRVDEPEQVVAILEAGPVGGVLVANPVDHPLDPAEHARVLAGALLEAKEKGIRGKAVTPFVLSHLHEATDGRTLRVNVEVVRGNARLAARIAASGARASVG
jgi:pseudouridine-5'-phosphate glycosidase